MRNTGLGLLAFLLCIGFAACAGASPAPDGPPDSSLPQTASAPASEAPPQPGAGSAAEQTEDWPEAPKPAAPGENMEGQSTLYITVGDRTLTATLAENTSAEALCGLLDDGPVSIPMQDYGGMEKVGDLGTTLPTNDAQITTRPGDLVLYQGSAFVIYYAPNTWSLTLLGTMDALTEEELREILGEGDVVVTLSLLSPTG